MSKIVKELGHGSFGIVYLLQAEDLSEYALKKVRQIKPKECDLKEAEILMHHCHPHLVKCFKFFKTGRSLYLITEYCGHGTLKHYIDQQKRYIPEKKVLRMLCQLSDVLRYLHDSKIIHRDLKPANIFLDTENNVKVGDVGVARQLDHTFDEASSVAGCWLYMSPEVRRPQSKYTSKADIWSLGCCVHEMMTLRRTFADVFEMLKMKIPVMSEDIYSQSLQDLVLEMLSIDPNKRPDAHDILFRACVIRGKRYKSADLVPNVEIAVSPRDICRLVTRFEAAEDLSSSSEEPDIDTLEESHTDNSETEETVKNRQSGVRFGDGRRKTAGTSDHEKISNLQSDTFSTVPTTKANRHRKGSCTFSTESARSDLMEQEDFIDNSLSNSRTGYSGSFEGAGSSEEATSNFTESSYSQHEYDSASDCESPVTLYTRAQHATYSNARDMSASDLTQSTKNVFADQSESLKELMLKRVAGIQSYRVDGKPMLDHPRF